MSFYKEGDTLGIVEPGPGYWAVTRQADILAASRNPQIYSSARGATSIPDMPPMLMATSFPTT